MQQARDNFGKHAITRLLSTGPPQIMSISVLADIHEQDPRGASPNLVSLFLDLVQQVP